VPDIEMVPPQIRKGIDLKEWRPGSRLKPAHPAPQADCRGAYRRCQRYPTGAGARPGSSRLRRRNQKLTAAYTATVTRTPATRSRT